MNCNKQSPPIWLTDCGREIQNLRWCESQQLFDWFVAPLVCLQLLHQAGQLLHAGHLLIWKCARLLKRAQTKQGLSEKTQILTYRVWPVWAWRQLGSWIPTHIKTCLSHLKNNTEEKGEVSCWWLVCCVHTKADAVTKTHFVFHSFPTGRLVVQLWRPLTHLATPSTTDMAGGWWLKRSPAQHFGCRSLCHAATASLSTHHRWKLSKWS